MKRLMAVCALIVALACMASSAKAGNSFDYCLLCHGSNANGNVGIRAPKLSGVEPWYLARQLENFAAGVRGTPGEDAAGHEMAPVALRLKQEGTLDSARPHATVKGDAVQGKKLYETCAACHGARGEGDGTNPNTKLAGTRYIIGQFQQRVRNGKGSAMPASGPDKISDDEIKTLHDWLQGLPGD